MVEREEVLRKMERVTKSLALPSGARVIARTNAHQPLVCECFVDVPYVGGQFTTNWSLKLTEQDLREPVMVARATLALSDLQEVMALAEIAQ